MADNKTHAAMRGHLAKAKAAHAQVGQSLQQLEQMLQAMQGAKQQPQAQPQGPSTGFANGQSPLGGMAR